jgi:hypothetical protein
MFTICQNLVASFKHQPCNKRYVFNILTFKANNHYDYIQDNCFLGQQFKPKKNWLKCLCMEIIMDVIW